MSDVDLTVLFATRNGEYVLPRTLEAYCRVQQPSRPWNMVIVDNGSGDSTSEILASFKKRLPLETFQQPVGGKSRALNLGLSAFEGRLLIITDDDAIPDPSFLTAWSSYLDRVQDYELFGGSIDPLFEVPPPKWIRRNKVQFDMLFAERNLPEGPIGPDEIYGPNMAFRSSIFQAGLRFNENIGPTGSDPYYPMGEEAHFCYRAVQNGAKAWFAKGPRVQHIIRATQRGRSFWAKRSYRHGRGFAKLVREVGLAAPPDASRPFVMDQLLRLRYWLQMFSPFPFQRFSGVCEYHWMRGFRDEWAGRLSTGQSSIVSRR